ncbi:MAG: MG2 domain-containing protein, partial [Chloroflexota bacterium]
TVEIRGRVPEGGVAQGEKKPISLDGTTLAQSWQVDVSQATTSEFGNSVQEVIIPADVPPGLYILNMATGHVSDQLIVVLTHHNLVVKQAEGQLVAGVTNINGEAAPNIRVGVYARDGLLIAEGRTDESGVYRAKVSRDPQPLIVIAGEGDDLTASGLTDEWRNGGYYRDWWRPAPKAQKYAAYIYTDRPIYRPGQTVYFKAIIRRDDDAVLSVLLQNSAVVVRIRDSRNNVAQTRQLLNNQFGTVNGEFKIAEGAMLGSYAVEVVIDDESHSQIFKVQDYRKPDYEVTVAADATSYVVGDTIRVTVDSSYFFGEPVPNAAITLKQYELGTNYCWEACVYEDTWFDLGRETITGKTDANGRFSFALPAALGFYGRNVYWWSDLKQSTIGIEATVDDGSHQTVSSFAAVKVFNAAEQIRLDTGGYLKTPGQPFTVQASARTIFDQPVSGRNLRLQLRQWNSDDRDYTTVLQSINLTTDANGLASGSLAAEKSGFYQAHLVGRDRRGNEIAYNRWLYVFSEADRWTGQSSGLSITAD